MKKNVYIIRVEGEGIKKNLMGGCGEKLKERFDRVIKTIASENDVVFEHKGLEGTFIYKDRDLSKRIVVAIEPLMEI